MKQNKLFVALAPSEQERVKIMQRAIVKLGFALIPGDAKKLIRATPYDFDRESYFVFASSYNFRASPLTTRSLVERAITGQAVVIGAKKLPPEMELFCEVIN